MKGMHVATALFVIFAVWRWGDWRHWDKYHNSMLFIALGNLLYNFTTAGYFLWRLDADFLSNHTLTEMVYTFVIFPGTALLYLCNYPTQTKKQIVHTGKWILIYILWELFFVLTGRIEYQYGWNIGWSFAFLFVMFPFLKLHQEHPLLTYVLSGVVAATVIWLFDVPVHVPVEQRSK
jgi:hypothetical protein